MPDFFDVLDLIPDSRNRNELIELAELHGVEVDMMLQVAADLNRAVDYEAIANAFGEHRDVVRRLRTELEALGFAIDQRGTSPGQQRSVQVS
jgi:hypothetical protein